MEARPINVLGHDFQIIALHALLLEELLPSVDASSYALHGLNRRILLEAEGLALRQRILDRRVRLLLANPQLLLAQSLHRGNNVVGGPGEQPNPEQRRTSEGSVTFRCTPGIPTALRGQHGTGTVGSPNPLPLQKTAQGRPTRQPRMTQDR